MSVPHFKRYVSIYPVLLAATDVMFMYHSYVVTHIGHDNYVYTKMFKSSEKSKIKYFESPRKEPLISKKIEEYFIYTTLTTLIYLSYIKHRI